MPNIPLLCFRGAHDKARIPGLSLIFFGMIGTSTSTSGSGLRRIILFSFPVARDLDYHA
jgi:hypothetical protein